MYCICHFGDFFSSCQPSSGRRKEPKHRFFFFPGLCFLGIFKGLTSLSALGVEYDFEINPSDRVESFIRGQFKLKDPWSFVLQ